VFASDLTEAEAAALPGGVIYFKEDPAWQELYGEVKELLGIREHVE
jgi:hypothetical protein